MIEHVGGEEEQRRFVAEVLRVGRRAFITTPNRWFPIEVHTGCRSSTGFPTPPRTAPTTSPASPGRSGTGCSAPARSPTSSPGTSGSSTSASPWSPSSTERLPRWALFAFVVALPFHNLVMAELWDAGVRDFALDVVSAWKEVLLAAALAVIVWRHRGVPFKATATDWLALVYAASSSSTR